MKTQLTPLTYPARPLNGGRLEIAPQKSQPSNWLYEPKLNEIRGLIHLPTQTIWNRHGERIDRPERYSEAMASITKRMASIPQEWLDCGLFYIRHTLMRGSICIYDMPNYRQPFHTRKKLIQKIFPTLNINNTAENQAFCLPTYTDQQKNEIWQELKNLNQYLQCEYYEGLVAKQADSPYPIQLNAPTQKFPYWIKHRFV